MAERHRLLRRQLAAHLRGESASVPGLARFLEAVDEAYRQSDIDRQLLERSLDLSSQELLQANDDMRAIVHAFPDVFLWIASDGTILGCRGQLSHEIYRSLDNLVGKAIRNIAAPESAEIIEAAVEQVRSGAEAVTIEYSLELAGTTRHYEVRFLPLREKQVLAIIRNITPRRTAEADLERSVSLLRATLESTADGILVVDGAGTIVSFNSQFVDIWRIPDEVLSTRDDRKALAYVLDRVSDPDGFLAKVQELYACADAESVDEIRLNDGRILERYSKPQRIGDRCVGRVWSFRDVTERRRAEEKLRESEQQLRQAQKIEAVGRLAGGVAHDFNNLLTAILGYSGMALEALGDHPARHDIEAVQRAAESASALTRQLLAFSRRQILQPQILDLNAVVRRMNSLLQRLIGEHITLACSLAVPLARISADPGQVEQIVLNLAVNARDAMPDGGKLTIETANVELDDEYVATHTGALAGPHVMLAMTDTGTGMDEYTRTRIFEPFFTTKARGEGTGLGLATVYGIVKQSRGFIWVYSEPGSGTAFKIYFPVAAVQAEISGSLAAPPERLMGTETILLAEDQPEVRSVTRAALARSGYRVLAAASGEEALRMAREFSGRIDLLLTDVVMPSMSGAELARRLQAEFPETAVLFASGYTDDAVVRHGVLKPGVAFIQKPYTPRTLVRKIREILGPSARARREYGEGEQPL